MSFPSSRSSFRGVKPSPRQRHFRTERNKRPGGRKSRELWAAWHCVLGRGRAAPAQGGSHRHIRAYAHRQTRFSQTTENSLKRSPTTRRVSRAAPLACGDAAVLPQRGKALDSRVTLVQGCRRKPRPNEKPAAE